MISDLYAFPPERLDLNNEINVQLIMAHRRLAELKGVSPSLPNQDILLNTLTLQEAKDSSAIENIITTNDDLFKEGLDIPEFSSAAAKEVGRYSEALRCGFEKISLNNTLTMDDLLEVQRLLVIDPEKQGVRSKPGTVIGNPITGQIFYEPPQDQGQIIELLENLLAFFIEEPTPELDPLVRMSLLHYQFEKIHPFYDGNGRTGRILNLLYMVLHDLLDLPVLYLSRYIIRNKAEYLNLFRQDQPAEGWHSWLAFMLSGVELTAAETIQTIHGLRELMEDYKTRIEAEHGKNLGLLNTIFKHPYTKIEFVMRDLGVTRKTASNYLEALTTSGFLVKEKIWRSNYYINPPLFELLQGKK
ncbi:MAG: Fic/DOC family N-terminal domain-containing protein [Anaerolineaceae bacterium]|nr:Fic/DOC family N-terminal domain-containing protein [Anaerolineaceae bacterium]